jgi:two-component SAPR family response regulator
MLVDGQPKPTVFIVEDIALIALALKQDLEGAGFDVVGTAPSVARALDFLEHTRPDIATLDMDLQGEIATPIARKLQSLGIPFVVVSAYGPEAKVFDAIFTDVPYQLKPVIVDRLITTMQDMLNRQPKKKGHDATSHHSP